MLALEFSKIIPGGNATIILHEPHLEPGELGAVSHRLMDPMHLQAEQVGALFYAERIIPRLEMMGGEFCVNATRAAALLLAGMGLLTPLHLRDNEIVFGEGGSLEPLQDSTEKVDAWVGEIVVSGMPAPVRVVACVEAAALHRCLERESLLDGVFNKLSAHNATIDDASGISPVTTANSPSGWRTNVTATGQPLFLWSDDAPVALHCAARVDCSQSGLTCAEIRAGLHLVSMPGMQHLLVDTGVHPFPLLSGTAWRENSAAWRRECGLEGAPASGVIWYRKENGAYRIWPAVEVLASNSEHLETACGSASLAVAFHHAHFFRSGSENAASSLPGEAVDVIQPSGETLRVFLSATHNASSLAAWVAGPVVMAAQGHAFL